MTAFHIGLPALRGSIEKYQTRFDLVEVRPVDTSVPNPKTLRRMRAATKASFAFSVVLPRIIGELSTSAEALTALETSLEVARILEARCIVLQTPSSVRPTSANRRRIASLFERLPPEGVVRCWEPQGIWERAEVLAVARESSAVAVLDAATEQPAPGPIVYTRLRALGKTATVSAGTLARIAERLQGRRDVYIIVEHVGEARRLRRALPDAVSDLSTPRPASFVLRPTPSILIAEDEEQ